MTMGDLGRKIPGSRHKEGHKLRRWVAGQHGGPLERGYGIPNSGKDSVGIPRCVVSIREHTRLGIVVEESKQAIGDVVDPEGVLIITPSRVRSFGDGHAQVLGERSRPWTADDPPIGISVEPYDRIAKGVDSRTVGLVRPECRLADGPGEHVAGFVVHSDRAIDHLHVIVEPCSATVVRRGYPWKVRAATVQFAQMKPFKAHDRV